LFDATETEGRCEVHHELDVLLLDG
jgi:hypothetical protein